jgi:hypothetical protein
MVGGIMGHAIESMYTLYSIESIYIVYWYISFIGIVTRIYAIESAGYKIVYQ